MKQFILLFLFIQFCGLHLSHAADDPGADLALSVQKVATMDVLAASAKFASNLAEDFSTGQAGIVYQSSDCGECVAKYCDYECDGIGNKCPTCIQKWCSFEC